MSIYGNLPPVNPEQTRARQQADRVERDRSPTTTHLTTDQPDPSPGQVDHVDRNTLAQAQALAKHLQEASTPSLHRLEDLRERIASGEYDAEPAELAEILLPVLRGEHPLS